MALIHLKLGNAHGPEFLKLGNMMTPVLGNGGDPGAFLSGELGWPLTLLASIVALMHSVDLKHHLFYDFFSISFLIKSHCQKTY